MSLISKLITPDAQPSQPAARHPRFNAYQAVAEIAGGLRQYQDIPQRFQKQWIASFLAVMVVVGLVAGLYLNVSARAAITGREIQSLELEIAVNERFNADLKTEIAGLLSNKVLETRALAQGFVPLKREELEYLVVPGFYEPSDMELIAPVVKPDVIASTPEFSESLLDWLARQIETASVPLAPAQ